MKRLRLTKVEFNRWSTGDILCEKDVLVGQIVRQDGFEWVVTGSTDNIIDSGICKTMLTAKRNLKKCLVSQGAKFSREIRKYKI